MSQFSMVPHVTEVNRIDGPYDIIVKLSDDGIDSIKESIGYYMARIPGIPIYANNIDDRIVIIVSPT